MERAALIPIPEQIDDDDDRDLGGVKLPFTILISEIDTYDSPTRKFTEIRANVPVDDVTLSITGRARKALRRCSGIIMGGQSARDVSCVLSGMRYLF